MNRIAITGLTLLFLARCDGSGEDAQASFSKAWPSSGIRQIKVETVHGDVEVRPSTDGQVRLAVEAHFEGRGAAAAARGEYLNIKVEDGVLHIIEKGRFEDGRVFNFGRNNRYLDFTIEAPATTALSLSNVHGEIDVIDAAGPTDLQTVNGEIAVNARSASVEASSVNGSIEANFVDSFRGAKLSTVNGPVEVTVPANASFICNVSQVNGGFESNIPMRIKRRGGINAVVGSGQATHTLEVSTVNGDVSLLREHGPEVATVEREVETTTGNEPEIVIPELPPLPEFHGSGGAQPPSPPAPPKPSIHL